MKTASMALALLMTAAPALGGGDAHPTCAEGATAGLSEKQNADLKARIKTARLTLTDALKLAESEGTPISAKYKLDASVLRLMVHTQQGDRFFKVSIDDRTGKILTTTQITDADKLAKVRQQAAALTQARRTLREELARVEQSNRGFRAIEIAVNTAHGTPETGISLLRGDECMEVTAQL